MISERAKGITPFIVMEVLEKAAEMKKQGIDVIHLEVGEPDFNVPACVPGAVQDAFAEGRTHYTHSLGDPELRTEIAKTCKEEYNADVNPEQIIVTSGSSPAILLVLGALCENGDEIILSNPGYACYSNFVKFVGAVPVSVNVFEEDGFQYRPENIRSKITGRTRAIIINSPMNPTGNVLSPKIMKELAQLEVPVISDEIYHGLVYENRAHSMLEFSKNTFILNGFSKRFAMTGLRLGYVICPPKYVRAMQKMQQNLFICASSTAQRAGISVLRNGRPEVEKMRNTYNERRKFVVKRLHEMGFDIKVPPTGAFYVFVNVKKYTGDCFRFAFDILENAHVGVTPGIDFGDNGEGFIRISYANSMENIKAGLDRLENYLKNV